ncbi:hypothetical protein [Sphingomonas sp. CFBP 8760]|uniref:hypothetical protein n=1 Tax=Sphingomonas sp. CFBP 8760 TaxID=2775282 RepID=UPI00177C6A33|nr:hypothetical protein [Sphingomonas sp. CFBP 8760]MBD8546963.1 hypothetical protein [Sphingomonas sp. CFBP 8760]
MVTSFTPSLLPMLAQVAGAIVGLLSLALVPPAHGTILIVSIAGDRVAEIANAALATGARISRRGPGDHSLIVIGDRDRLIGLSRRGLIPLAAPDILCGA